MSDFYKRIWLAVFIAILLSFSFLASCGGYHSMGDFRYHCKKGGGMFDGVSCRADIEKPYWLWVQEGGRIVLMHDRAGAGIDAGPKNGQKDMTSLAKLGLNDRFVIAALDNYAWYIFDHGDDPKTKWVKPEGPFTKEDVVARVKILPKMRVTRTAD